MSRQKHIPAQKNEADFRLSEELLLAYLEERLSPDERRKVEEALSREGMESDAIDGLQALGQDQARHMQDRLNSNLNGLLSKRRKRRRALTGQRWIWLAIVLILLFAVLGYAVIYLMKRQVR